MRRSGPAFCLILLAGLLSACGSPDALSRQAAARNAPFGADPSRHGVDGLLVGHRLLEAGENELALRAYRRAASERGITADVLSALGSANLRLGRLQQAEQLLRRAIKMDPTFVPAINNLGVVLMEQGKELELRRLHLAAEVGLIQALGGGYRKPVETEIPLSQVLGFGGNAPEKPEQRKAEQQ